MTESQLAAGGTVPPVSILLLLRLVSLLGELLKSVRMTVQIRPKDGAQHSISRVVFSLQAKRGWTVEMPSVVSDPASHCTLNLS